MTTNQAIPVASNALPADYQSQRGGNGRSINFEKQKYLTTTEAAEYLRKSVSWLTRQPDIPYLRGIPNTYKREDLDDWFERNKFVPVVAA
jgi:hypothetical protein